MKNKFIKNKNLNIILNGIFVLALEIYGLKFLQAVDVQISSSFNMYSYQYILNEPTVTISMSITIIGIIIAFILGIEK